MGPCIGFSSRSGPPPPFARSCSARWAGSAARAGRARTSSISPCASSARSTAIWPATCTPLWARSTSRLRNRAQRHRRVRPARLAGRGLGRALPARAAQGPAQESRCRADPRRRRARPARLPAAHHAGAAEAQLGAGRQPSRASGRPDQPAFHGRPFRPVRKRADARGCGLYAVERYSLAASNRSTIGA